MAADLSQQSQVRFDKAAVTVAVPSITASGTANVGDGVVSATATVTGVAIGDVITAAATAALPTNAIFLGAFASAADTVTFLFTATANLAVTGANRTFNVHVIDKT